MKALRLLTMAIGFLVLTHSVVMTSGFHAPVQAAGYNHHHAFEMDHEPAPALVCGEGEAVSPGARVPLEPSALLALAMAGVGVAVDTGEPTGHAPEAPSLAGKTLRAFLQVFLN